MSLESAEAPSIEQQSQQAIGGSSSSRKAEVPAKGIGLLFIIIDDLPHEAIWRLWIEEGSKKLRDQWAQDHPDCTVPHVRVWVHAKHPERVRSSWVQERLVKTFHLSPAWGSIEITSVMLKMLTEAVSVDKRVSKFIFASESCIPIEPFEVAWRDLVEDNSSWVNYTSTPNNGFSKQLQVKPSTNVISLSFSLLFFLLHLCFAFLCFISLSLIQSLVSLIH